MKWYTSMELRHDTIDCDYLANSFNCTFSYANEIPSIDEALQVIKDNFFEEISIPMSSLRQQKI